ncbi:MAG TPA: SDR family oxidoreductase [Gaiellaceae bacterium]|nr:SDR family oxidoreductase [Gaiellaceae bacterium]
MTRSVLVTGASSGIGQACALRLSRAGWHVLAGVRGAGDAPDGTEEVLLDVTEPAPLTIDRLDGLVNNAGVAVAGPLEFLPADELRHQLEVNVVGQLRVVQMALPALRASRGRIVNIGSISGRSALPFLGAYAMSKFGLEAMSDSLRVELRPWGIHVAIVEPGTIRTAMWTRERPDPPPEALALYGERLAAFRTFALKRSAHGAPPEAVAAVVESALTADRPRVRYLVGRDARLRAGIERLPGRVRDGIYKRVLLGGT